MPSLVLIAAATLISEDLACIAAGVLVAQGRLGFLSGTVACLLGIFSGDLLLYWAGRAAGRAALRLAIFRRLAPPEKIERASSWLSSRGPVVILLSRFTPGLRLPTYFAAGLLKTHFWRFAALFFVASAIWAPLLVGAAAVFGEQALRGLLDRWGSGWLALVAILISAIWARNAFSSIADRDRRHRLAGLLRRKLRWEFWPAWAAYLPLSPLLLWLAIRHRSLTLFTAANPGIPTGGFAGESKAAILDQLTDAGVVPVYERIEGSLPACVKTARAQEFLERHGLTFPVVLKPDVGERGNRVAVVGSADEMAAYLHAAEADVLIQQYVEGCEFGAFYVRYPDQEHGHVISITEKRFPEVVGDGSSTLAQLILRDRRAVCLADVYFRRSRRPIDHVPAMGEHVRLVDIGSHCKGAIFLDGGHLKTDALEEAVDRVSRSHPGFFFGRYDLRASTVEEFQAGRFHVIELNGVSAEATHIYDPSVSLWAAYRTLFLQWQMAFEIGAANRRCGAQPVTVAALLTVIRNRRTPEAVRSGAAPAWQPSRETR